MSRPYVGTVGPVPILIWPFSSLFYLPKSTISPKSIVSSSLWGLNLLHQDNDTLPLWQAQALPWTLAYIVISLLRGPPCSQPQSLPGVQPPESEPQHPAPIPHGSHVNRSSAGNCWLALISAIYSLHTCWCAPLWGSKASCLCLWGHFQVCLNFLLHSSLPKQQDPSCFLGLFSYYQWHFSQD